MGEKHWTVEENKNYDPPWVLRYAPGSRKNPDGSTTISVSFPALQATDWVAEPETALVPIATALNRDGIFDEMVDALSSVDESAVIFGPKGDEAVSFSAMEKVRRVLTKAREAGK
jgi:hypothetical protein